MSQRLGSPLPTSPVSYGASLETSSRFSFALSPDVWPIGLSFSAVVEPEDQRSHRALLLARPPAHDHHVDRADVLDLDHPLALPGDVGGVELLRDHALARKEPGLGGRHVLRQRGQLDGTRRGFLTTRRRRDQLSQRLAALRERRLHQLGAVDRQRVEGAKQRRRLLRQHLHAGLGGVQTGLERVEHLAAVVVEDDQLAVDHVAALGEDELGEVAEQRLCAAGLQEDLVAVDERDRSEAVVLRLVGPLLALGQDLAGKRELGLDRRLERERHWRRVYDRGDGRGRQAE